jgi:hypothetical protein
MVTTGESCAVARPRAITASTARPGPPRRFLLEDVRAAFERHRELGPYYSDAVVASFIDKVDRAVAAR